jgi:hypothetical protein
MGLPTSATAETLVSHMGARAVAQTHLSAANDSFAPIPERLIWLVELMSRYAREYSQSHESPRLAAAILAHLKALANELPTSQRLSETTEHWIDVWEPILDQHIKPGSPMPQPLRALIDRARAF